MRKRIIYILSIMLIFNVIGCTASKNATDTQSTESTQKDVSKIKISNLTRDDMGDKFHYELDITNNNDFDINKVKFKIYTQQEDGTEDTNSEDNEIVDPGITVGVDVDLKASTTVKAESDFPEIPYETDKAVYFKVVDYE